MSMRSHILRLSRFCAWSVVLLAFWRPLWAYDEPEATGPEIISVYPLAVQRGTNVSVAVRGRLLEGAYAVVFEGQGITAQVDRIETIETPVPDPETVADQSQAKDAGLRVVARVDVEQHDVGFFGLWRAFEQADACDVDDVKFHRPRVGQMRLDLIDATSLVADEQHESTDVLLSRLGGAHGRLMDERGFPAGSC